MSAEDVLNTIAEKEVKFVDLRFTDTRGKEQHVSVPAKILDEGFFEDGKMFDGSSIAGWKGIQESDMVLMPDPDSAILDPFMDETTLNLRCNVLDPLTMTGYERCSRSLAGRAIAYMQSTGIADDVFFGPEPEFFVFDSVTWNDDMSGASYRIRSEEADWSKGLDLEDGNMGHRPGVKGGYFPVPPVDSLADIRAAMCLAMEEMGLTVEVHHHEVATAGQCEIGTEFASLIRKADELQILKYCVHNVAHVYGKTATFMPKPLVGDNGSGMHCPPVAVRSSGKQHILRRQVRRPLAGGPVVRRRRLQARPRPERLHQLRNQQLQASRAGLRGSGAPRLLGNATARPPCAFPHSSAGGAAAWKCASPIRAGTPTSPSRPS